MKNHILIRRESTPAIIRLPFHIHGKFFNPDIEFSFSLPICNIRENLLFGIKIGYDLSLDKYEQESTSSWIKSDTYTHFASLLPTLSLIKGNAQLFIDSGVRFGISIYSFQLDNTITNQQRTLYLLYQFFWILETGIRYQLTTHLSIIGTRWCFE